MAEVPVNQRKKEVRQAVRRGLCAMSVEEKLRESDAIWRRVESLDEFRSARVVALYWSLPDEPYTHEVADKWSRTKTVLLPCIEGDEIVLRRYEGRERMCSGAFCIDEPVGEVWGRLQDIDLIIVPGVAFSGDGGRVGRGRGFYDRLFARLGGAAPGVALAPTVNSSVPVTAPTSGATTPAPGYTSPDGAAPTPGSSAARYGATTPDSTATTTPSPAPSATMSPLHNTAGNLPTAPGHTAVSASPAGLHSGRTSSANPFPVVFPLTVGVAFSCQVVREVPLEAHDIVLDMVISG